MADIYSPWLASSEEDVTSMGLITPEYLEMYAEAQEGPGAEAELELETEPEIETPEPESEPNHELMMQAMSTMQKQADTISMLLSMMTGQQSNG
jgi:hypothetical protein